MDLDKLLAIFQDTRDVYPVKPQQAVEDYKIASQMLPGIRINDLRNLKNMSDEEQNKFWVDNLGPGALSTKLTKHMLTNLEKKTFHGGHKWEPNVRNELGWMDNSKIGQGEGANIFSEGLYHSESPKIASSYYETLKTLPGINKQKILGNFMKDTGYDLTQVSKDALSYYLDNLAHAAKLTRLHMEPGSRAIKNHTFTNDAMLELLLKDKLGMKSQNDMIVRQAWPTREAKELGLIDYLYKNQDQLKINPPSGAMYELGTPQSAVKEHFLDWDRTFNEQPLAVRKGLQNYLESGLKKNLKMEFAKGSDFYETIKNLEWKKKHGTDLESPSQITGQLAEDALVPYGIYGTIYDAGRISGKQNSEVRNLVTWLEGLSKPRKLVKDYSELWDEVAPGSWRYVGKDKK